MPMSDDERRQLRELETQLAGQRRLVKLARRLGAASVDTGLPRISVLWGPGGRLGLILVIAGAVVRSTVLIAAGVVILAVTLLLAGAAIAVGVAEYRREHRPRGGRPPRSPSRRPG